MGLLVSEKKLAQFNDLDTAIKTAFTKMYNNLHSSSIKATKKKGGAPAPPGSGFGSKFDPDIQERASDEGMSSSDDDDKDEVVAAKGSKAGVKKGAEPKGKKESKKDLKKRMEKEKEVKVKTPSKHADPAASNSPSKKSSSFQTKSSPSKRRSKLDDKNNKEPIELD